jgi:hypothetical protein
MVKRLDICIYPQLLIPKIYLEDMNNSINKACSRNIKGN